jgi:hypothetical protein
LPHHSHREIEHCAGFDERLEDAMTSAMNAAFLSRAVRVIVSGWEGVAL